MVFEKEDWIRSFQQFIVALRVDRRKTGGIYFGHRMIAQALRGKMRRSERDWGIGVQKITLAHTTAEPWMQAPYREELAAWLRHFLLA
ncbi:MAG: hypothetical protein OSB29_00190 [Verrucomicrobiota bacterium]|nr:hypothetical protein [Verrucomicrobiota bacterium]